MSGVMSAEWQPTSVGLRRDCATDLPVMSGGVAARSPAISDVAVGDVGDG